MAKELNEDTGFNISISGHRSINGNCDQYVVCVTGRYCRG